MERLESLGNAISQITLYDIKSMYNQAKNVVLNVSEMEAKVREATNDEPWGASSSLMQDIANGTFNFQNFNEIMPCIYARFMEKEAKQWRQIYKALQLLEYLIKHGSERVVDDARSHISTLKMLRNFHYVDEKGKDEGLNVRNRSRELVELLQDVDKIRQERRKAKANKHKYVGTGNDNLRYAGFGSDSYSSGGIEYSGYAGSSTSTGFRDDSRRSTFQEYNAGEDEISVPSRRRDSIPQRVDSSSSPTDVRDTPASPPKLKEPAKAVNLLDGFDDEDALENNPAKIPQINKALPNLSTTTNPSADDDFADFIAAPTTSPPRSTAPLVAAPVTGASLSLMEILNSPPNRNATGQAMASNNSQPHRPTMGNQTTNFTFGGVLSPTTVAPHIQQNALHSSTLTPSTTRPTIPTSHNKSSSGFDDLWAMSLGSGAPTRSNTSTPKIKDLQKEKVEADIWGLGQKTQQKNGASSAPFGGFVSAPSSTKGGDLDDLLL